MRLDLGNLQKAGRYRQLSLGKKVKESLTEEDEM